MLNFCTLAKLLCPKFLTIYLRYKNLTNVVFRYLQVFNNFIIPYLFKQGATNYLEAHCFQKQNLLKSFNNTIFTYLLHKEIDAEKHERAAEQDIQQPHIRILDKANRDDVN